MFGFLLLSSFIMLVPYLWMVLSSLKGNLEIIRSTDLLPHKVTFEGYKTVFQDAPFMHWLWNSIVTSTAITIVTVFTSALAGYIFAKFRFRGKQVLFIVILATMMIPTQILMIPSYLIIFKLGLINNLLALIIPSLISAFGIFLARQAIDELPYDLMESARMDGAGEFYTFLRIILPLVRPMLSALAIFTFMAAWNNYVWPLIVLNDTEKMTLPLALVFFNGAHVRNFNIIMSASVLVMIPVLVVFLIFQKQFIKGLSMTGFK
ncbi:carbohydrate ABC transporter permease [Cohnella pontilimi]|uniref:Carbohydrate ABC transporter permease n=2 Tax=Cohnella pontilimi TaxID=2564100 RepID=A0A4U0FC81_9BACL|nr:carbohydrate ABC transporter permease [Cohnella pontilimi]